MLRESVKPQIEQGADTTVSVDGINRTAAENQDGDQALLTALVDAAHEGSQEDASTASAALAEALGPEALIDAAAVYGNFERMNCIADAIGIELEGMVAGATAELREAQGYNTMPRIDRLRS